MTAQDFIFKVAPYKKIKGEDYVELYKELSNDKLSVDGFNPIRNVESTFHLCSNTLKATHWHEHPNLFEPVDSRVRCMSFQCGRFRDVLTLIVYHNQEEEFLLKMGTYPSLRDFHKDDIKRFNKVLTEQQKSELVTAIMIASNGVGIGSYVYLRRIFESIVFEEAEKAISDGKITKADFENKRMDEKIVLIKNYLPSFLYDHHKELYGILSMGVHQLDEEDCLSFFPVLYSCITMILEDRLAQKEKEETSKRASASLSKIAARIKK